MQKLLLALILGSHFLTHQAAIAQVATYPNHQIKIISPFAIGGIADGFSRIIAQGLSEAYGQPVIVENKTGGGGNIGADFVAKSPADGYTLIMGSIGTHAVNPYLVKSMPYDPFKDFVPVAFVLDAEGLLAVNPSVPVKNVSELISYIKANPGKVSYGSGGIGTASHLAGELFVLTAKVDMTHIPYKGNALAITDLIGGQVNMFTADFAVTLPQVQAGKIRGLAVTSLKRSPAIPELPTVNEALGIKGYELIAFFAAFGPAGMPKDAVMKLNKAINDAAKSKDLVERFSAMGFESQPGTPEALGQKIKLETAKWAKAIKEAGMEPE